MGGKCERYFKHVLYFYLLLYLCCWLCVVCGILICFAVWSMICSCQHHQQSGKPQRQNQQLQQIWSAGSLCLAWPRLKSFPSLTGGLWGWQLSGVWRSSVARPASLRQVKYLPPLSRPLRLQHLSIIATTPLLIC